MNRLQRLATHCCVLKTIFSLCRCFLSILHARFGQQDCQYGHELFDVFFYFSKLLPSSNDESMALETVNTDAIKRACVLVHSKNRHDLLIHAQIVIRRFSITM